MALRVIDWNVHHDGVGTDGVADLGRIAAWLQSRNPDIVTMNEISAAAAADLESRDGDGHRYALGQRPLRRQRR